MNKLIKDLIAADISMNLVEFGAAPVTNFIMDVDNESREIITMSKMINSEYMASVKYGLSLSEDILPRTMGINSNIIDSLEKVFVEEYYDNQCEMNDTFMAVAVGSHERGIIVPVAIYHKYGDRARFYYLALLKGQVLIEGRNEIIGAVGAAIALHKDKDVPDHYFIFQGRNILKAVKEYGNNELVTSVRE